MDDVKFADEEKVKVFDELAQYYYKANFGQMSKSDIDLLMFRFYLEKMHEIAGAPDGGLDYNKFSDFRISKALGITQQRVHNLKIKCHLKYPEKEHDWKKSFAKLVKNARYDNASKKIIVSIPDPNLFYEIQNFLEEKGAFIEKQLNSKILQMRIEYFLDLVYALESDDVQKKILKQIKKDLKNANKTETLLNEQSIGESLIKTGADITTVLANISGMISPDNIIGIGFKNFLESLKG